MKIHYPSWLAICYTICYGVCILMFAWYLYLIYSNQLIRDRLWDIAFLFLFLLIGLWPIFHFFSYSVIATNEGVENRPLVGVKKKFTWPEIAEVRQPKFKIPYNVIYVVTQNNKKIVIWKEMNNINQMIDFIKNMSPNLRKCIY